MSLEMKWVKAGELRANPWNPNVVSPENELKIEASINRAGGLFKPVVVRQVKGVNGYEILGGEHRVVVARRLGYEDVPISNVGFITDKLAREIGQIDNGRYGEDDTLKLAELFKDIGADMDEIQSFLPVTSDDIASIFAASTVALDDLDALSAAQDSNPEPGQGKEATHQIMRFKVPVEDVAWITAHMEKTIRAQGFTGEDSLTNAGNAFVYVMNRDRNSQ